MYKASVNNQSFEVSNDGETWIVNGHPLQWDVSALSPRHFSIIYQNRSYNAEVVKIDNQTKTIELKLNGRKQTVQLRDGIDLLLEKMGMNTSDSTKINAIRAPMPGLIIDLKIKPGDSVSIGDPLLVLEAMKMENVLKAHGEGIVKQVKVKKGDSVEKGQLLIEF